MYFFGSISTYIEWKRRRIITTTSRSQRQHPSCCSPHHSLSPFATAPVYNQPSLARWRKARWLKRLDSWASYKVADTFSILRQKDSFIFLNIYSYFELSLRARTYLTISYSTGARAKHAKKKGRGGKKQQQTPERPVSAPKVFSIRLIEARMERKEGRERVWEKNNLNALNYFDFPI